MSKADEFIREHTRNCSNLMQVPTLDDKGNIVPEAHPWLTPDQARRAVEIEREEMIDKFCEFVKKNVTYTHPRKGTQECVINLDKLKEAMRND